MKNFMPKKPEDRASDLMRQQQGHEIPQPTINKIADNVMTAVVATSIVQSGRGVAAVVAKNPWVMFGLGLATGYLAHKYRREIITLSVKSAEYGKDFLLQQKRGLETLLHVDNNPQEPD